MELRAWAAQLQAKRTELEELANALRDKAQLVAQLQGRVRAEELAEVPTPLAMPQAACPQRSSLQRWQVPRQRHSETGWLDVKPQPQPKMT